MKLAISNLAWQPEDELAMAEQMTALGIEGVEIVPTRRWPAPLEATDAEIAEYRRFWQTRGIRVVALQALLYSRPDLVLFGSTEARRSMIDYLAGLARLAAGLGASVLVFGAGAHRKRGGLSESEAWSIAHDFFGAIGQAAARHGATFCLEALPAVQGCDFITDTTQALAMVERVGSPGFALNFDTACMRLAGEDFAGRLLACGNAVRHVHLSEPGLGPLAPGGTLDVRAASRVLSASGYAHWMSIEMRAAPFEDVVQSLRFARASLE